MLKLRNAILVSFSVILLMLAACGGEDGSDSTTTGGGSYPIVAYVSPAPGSRLTPSDTVVFDIYFDEDMDGSTINSSSIELKNCLGVVVSATLTHEKSHVRMTHPSPFIGGEHTLFVHNTVKSSAGINMQYDYECSIYFDLSWGAAQLIETDNTGAAWAPQPVIDSNGNVTVVWQQSDGTRDNIWANRYTVGTGWGTAQLIETDNAGAAGGRQAVIDPNGNVTVAWSQSDGTRSNIWANRYIAGTGWGTAQLIETDNAGDAISPQLAVDINGNVTVVWRQSDGTRDNMWSNRYTPGTGWGTAVLIETDNEGGAYSPAMAVDSSGNVTVVWNQFDGTRNNNWANRYTVGTGWGTATLIETDSGFAYSPQLVVDSSGNVTVVWVHYDGTRMNIWANRYTTGTGWSGVQLIESSNFSADTPAKPVVDSSGNVTVVWRQTDGTRDNMWANRYTVGIGWGTAQLIETDNAGSAIAAWLGIDSNGNVTVVWQQSDGSRDNLWANRYTVGIGWGTAQLIEQDNMGSSTMPQLAVDSIGNVTVVWKQFDGMRYNIWANRYIVGTGWDTAQLIETDNTGSVENPQLTVDSNGNVTAVWYQSDGMRNNMWANRFE